MAPSGERPSYHKHSKTEYLKIVSDKNKNYFTIERFSYKDILYIMILIEVLKVVTNG